MPTVSGRSAPITRSSAAPRRTPTSSSSRARPRVPYYAATLQIVEDAFAKLATRTGRTYHAFDYVGDPEAERVIVMMGSGIGAAEEALAPGCGLLKVRLYRPFDGAAFAAALPETTKALAVLDRSKDPAALGEPLYEDVITALAEQGRLPRRLLGGRYGLGSKEFTPAMATAVFAELAAEEPHLHFTVGIDDDVSHSSLTVDPSLTTEPDDVVRCVFYGLGSDGTVGANKNSAKIIATQTPLYSQGYFVIDSKKSGSTTVSHLRFGPRPIRSSYLVEQAQFVACHQFDLLARMDVLDVAAEGATVLLNAPYGPDEIWDRLPRGMQEQIVAKHLRVYVIDASHVAREAGLPGRVNTVLQACFFGLSGVLPAQRAIGAIKEAIAKTYAKRGEEIVQRNFRAVDMALDALHEVDVDRAITATNGHVEVHEGESDLIRALIAGRGDSLPVSALPVDGTFPLGTARFEKRNLADELPIWDEVDLHRLRQVRARLPARRHSHEGVRAVRTRGRARRLQVEGVEGEGPPGDVHDDPGLAGRLHRLPHLRRDVPGEGQAASRAQVARLAREGRARRRRARALGLLPHAPGDGPHEGAAGDREGLADAAAAVRVLRRLLGLRRDAVPEAPDAAVRRPHARRERDRVLVHLRRQPADDAVDDERRRARPRVGELALRGQRRVRIRHAPRARPAGGAGQAAPRRARRRA